MRCIAVLARSCGSQHNNWAIIFITTLSRWPWTNTAIDIGPFQRSFSATSRCRWSVEQCVVKVTVLLMWESMYRGLCRKWTTRYSPLASIAGLARTDRCISSMVVCRWRCSMELSRSRWRNSEPTSSCEKSETWRSCKATSRLRRAQTMRAHVTRHHSTRLQRTHSNCMLTTSSNLQPSTGANFRLPEIQRFVL